MTLVRPLESCPTPAEMDAPRKSSTAQQERVFIGFARSRALSAVEPREFGHQTQVHGIAQSDRPVVLGGELSDPAGPDLFWEIWPAGGQ